MPEDEPTPDEIDAIREAKAKNRTLKTENQNRK